MSSSANVKAFKVLDELRGALMRFKSEAQSVIHDVEGEMKRTRDWLQERLAFWQHELRRRQRKLEEAQAALSACEALGSLAGRNCSPLVATVARAKQMVREAEQELRVVQDYMKRFEEVASSYQQQARRLTGTLDGELLKGAALLSNSASILQSYVGGSASGIAASLSTPVVPSQSTPGTPSSMTANIGGSTIQMVPIADIDLSDSHVKGPSDFIKGISPDQMIEGFHKLFSVVVPAVAQGADDTYFAQLDASQGLENANSYLHIYCVFFSDKISRIRLGKIGDRYAVENGYHRLFIAQQLGITEIPAEIVSFQP